VEVELFVETLKKVGRNHVTFPPILFTVQHQNLIYSNSPLPLADVKELADLEDLTDAEDLADGGCYGAVQTYSDMARWGQFARFT
jgi:hypothetical protein